MGCGSLISKHGGAARTLPHPCPCCLPAGTLVRLQGARCKSMGCVWLCTTMVLISRCKYGAVHAGGVQAIKCFDRFCAEQNEKSPVKCGFLSLKQGVFSALHTAAVPLGAPLLVNLLHSLVLPSHGQMPVSVPTVPWGACVSGCVFSSKKVTKSACLCLHTFASFWHILVLLICSQLHLP